MGAQSCRWRALTGFGAIPRVAIFSGGSPPSRVSRKPGHRDLSIDAVRCIVETTIPKPLLLRGLRGRWSRRLRLHWLRLNSLQHGLRAAMPRCINRECNRRHQEQHSRPRGRPRKGAGRTPRTKRRLAALTAERRGNVPALAALQQHHHDDEETDKNVNSND
jgi:hypothetical protein